MNTKDKTAAGILAIVLGTLGIHYFYIGKTTAGLICLLVSLLSCGTLAIVVQVLTIIQGVKMLEADEATFYNKWVNTPETFPLF